jgi:signal transduction histidine kinase
MLAGYSALYGISHTVIPPSAALYPEAAVAVAGLFFGGLRLWPFVVMGSILSGVILGIPLPQLLTMATTDVFQAIAGAWLLRTVHIDPLFRKNSDMYSFILTVLCIALFSPTVSTLTYTLLGLSHGLAQWGHEYIGSIFTLLIITPFLLRWCAKLSFRRSLHEAIEVVAIFGLLLAICTACFVLGNSNVLGINLLYLTPFPLLWIALRLRPRFITLALLILSVFAMWGVFVATSPNLLSGHIYGTETLLITISIIFLTIVSLEEDRRLNTNLMRSQLSTLENAVARISSESQAKNDFIAILAHELRNPLAPVVSAIDYLKLGKERSAEEMEMLDMMEYMMQTVRRLLDDLLDVSRISEGKLTIKKERVELGPIIKRSILSVSHAIKERHQNITFNDSPQKIFILGDSVRLEQIFSNLLTNASKYSDPGDPITITFKKSETMAEIMVKDRGVGIPPESIENIFIPFHQVGSGKRTQKGLGIGLALVENFVKIHGGTVVAASEGQGKGSTFTIRLPLLKDKNI